MNTETPSPRVPPLLASASETRRRRSGWGWFAGAAALVLFLGAWVLYAFPPETTRLYPKCSFHQMTGLHCPGCGSTRALHHLTHGRLPEALRSNLLLVLALAAVLVAAARGLIRPREASRVEGGNLMVRLMPWLAVALIVFGVLRNLPWYPFNLLAP